MYQVLIVDDEPKIRQGLCRFIERANLPLCVCAQADDGEIALELAQKYKPDIVFLDICMPRMDGIAFLSALRREQQHTKCFVITGYDEFAFAQASVQLKAYAYLLKPIDEAMLIQQLKDAITELDAEKKQEDQSLLSKRIFAKNQSLIRQQFAKDWVNARLSKNQIDEQMKFLKIEWPETAFLILVKPDFQTAQVFTQREQSLVFFIVDNMLSELLASFDLRFHASDEQQHCFALTAQNPSMKIREQLLDSLQQHFSMRCYLQSIEISSPYRLAEYMELLKEKMTLLESSHPILELAKQYINEHFSDPDLSLIDLAKALCVSQSQICKLFKNDASTTFVESVTQRRINEAMKLLSETDDKLSVIASQIGFLNQHYFSAVFKKYLGISPSVYREQKQQ